MRIAKRIGLVLLGLLVVVTALNLTIFRMPPEPPLPAGSKFAEISGKRIHYVEKPGKEPAVLMVHGLPGTWGDFDAVAAGLKGRRTIQIDRPGYAFSSAGYVPFNQQVETLRQLTQQLSLKKPVIVGHSYGGAMALTYAYKYPDQVSGIVAVDPAVEADDIPLKRKAQGRFIQVMDLPVLHQLGALTIGNITRRASLDVGGKEAFDPDPVDPGWNDRALALNARYRDLTAVGSEMLAAQGVLRNLEANLARITMPIEIIQGEGDRLVSTTSVRAAADQIARAELKILPGGHMQTYVHPDAVVAAILRAEQR